MSGTNPLTTLQKAQQVRQAEQEIEQAAALLTTAASRLTEGGEEPQFARMAEWHASALRYLFIGSHGSVYARTILLSGDAKAVSRYTGTPIEEADEHIATEMRRAAEQYIHNAREIAASMKGIKCRAES